MYPLAHSSIALIFRKDSKNILFLLFCCLLTILPDFDFLIGMTHRGFTHSILFSLIIGILISRKEWLYYSGLTLSHPILDMLCEDYPRGGVQLFWPFQGYFQFPFHPFKATPILESMALEVFIVISLIILVNTLKKAHRFFDEDT